MSIVKKPKLVDAQAMRVEHLGTFEAPTREELDSLRPGVYVKICAETPAHFNPVINNWMEGERFWVEVTEVNGETVRGVVSNDLIASQYHDLFDGDNVEFHKHCIYTVGGSL